MSDQEVQGPDDGVGTGCNAQEGALHHIFTPDGGNSDSVSMHDGGGDPALRLQLRDEVSHKSLSTATDCQ